MKRLFDDGWKFLLTDYGTEYSEAISHADFFEDVDIPHDWQIADSCELYKDGTAWYIKEFDTVVEGWNPEDRCIITFDAVYMDSTYFLNGEKIGEWRYGYSRHSFDISDRLKCGKNLIAVSANFKNPNSRWYSGAGIIRDVFIDIGNKEYISDIYVHSEKKTDSEWLMNIAPELSCDAKKKKAVVRVDLLDENGHATELSGNITDGFIVKDPKLWDISEPHLYELHVFLTDESGDKVYDEKSCRIGFRTVKMDPDKGFFLNGRHVKLHGVCEHHDLGALGAAFNKDAMRRKFTILKQMGVNAVRLSHNMSAEGAIELADEMGMLVMSEAFDMWELSKTEYDYARFFKEWSALDVESWVRQDRNHPSVILWSIGNEIYDAHVSEHGQEITAYLKKETEKYDPLHNAVVTFASNYLAGENAQRCGDILKTVGYNYAEKLYRSHHEKYPDWNIYGSETASIVSSRGIYHFPLSQSLLAEEDEQCSSLGNSQTSWGARSWEECICGDRDTDFSMGQFLWTGFDYIGEPTPYHTKNSYFGQIDTSGFPKDAFYAFKSEWAGGSAPFVHVFPYWDWTPGQRIDVRICSNLSFVELFVNGRSLGRQKLTHEKNSGDHIIANYEAIYEPGEITAVGYDRNGKEAARMTRHSFGDSAKIKLEIQDSRCEKSNMIRGLAFVTISTEDSDGNPVENAIDRVNVDVTGAGRLVGLDNGDSTDMDSYKGVSRRLFSGKLLAVIAPVTESGVVHIKVSGRGLISACTDLNIVKGDAGLPLTESSFCRKMKIHTGTEDEIPVRKITLSVPDGTRFSPDKKELTVSALISPEAASDKTLTFEVTDEHGIKSNIIDIHQTGNVATLTAKGDGKAVVRCLSKGGTDGVRVISTMGLEATGIGKAYLDPYDLVAGCLYSPESINVSNGNEKGACSARNDRTLLVYKDVDFGKAGSDIITMPLFALDDREYIIELWDGIPGTEGAYKVSELHYQKPSIWNTYQEETWRLPKLFKGIKTLSLVLYDKVHVKGFSFEKLLSGKVEWNAGDADGVYGDSFVREDSSVNNIGNNVSLNYNNLDFGEDGATNLLIKGRALHGTNTITIRCNCEDGREIKKTVEFEGKDICSNTFEIDKLTGIWNITFIFLPGSAFDFDSFRFS